jgi:hypothetical protein
MAIKRNEQVIENQKKKLDEIQSGSAAAGKKDAADLASEREHQSSICAFLAVWW